jgi:glycosyltransferase involved in cell wall biosynthesis
VSIIIPCYNYGAYLPSTLKSLQEQTFDRWECWVIDDGSTDNTGEVVNNFSQTDSRFKYYHQENEGQPTARNTGLLKAHGFFVQFLDADDLLEKEKINAQLNFLQHHSECDIVYGPVKYFASNDTSRLFKNRWDDEMREWMPKISGNGFPVVEEFVQGNIFELGCALFRRSAIEAIGLFNADLQGVEDYDYCFRGATRELFFAYFEDEHTNCLMRHHPESFSKNLFQMYKKELMLRRLMNATLQVNGFDKLISLNKNKYASRLRRLQEMVIDEMIKGKKKHFNAGDMKWIYDHSGLKQKLFFFPRILKAFVAGSLLNNR